MISLEKLSNNALAENLSLGSKAMPDVILNPNVRHTILMLNEVKNANPNGDPNHEGKPRRQSGHGVISHVSQKYKLRRYVESQAHRFEGERERLNIYITPNAVLSEKMNNHYSKIGLNAENIESEGKAKKTSNKNKKEIVKYKASYDQKVLVTKSLLETFYDNRMFGACHNEGYQGIRTTGKVIFSDAVSVHPITTNLSQITRWAVNDPNENSDGDNQTMGNYENVDYGLYLHKITYNPNNNEAQATETDMRLLWESLMFMNQTSQSTTRNSGIGCRGLFIFSHSSALGNALDWMLYDLFDYQLRENCKTPKNFSDYEITIDNEGIPASVTMTRLI